MSSRSTEGFSGTVAGVNARLAAVAARNGGPFTAAQAYQAGYRPADVRRLLAHGTWQPLGRSVYMDAALLRCCIHDPARRHAVEVAAVLLQLRGAGSAAVGSRESAARLLKLSFLTEPSAQVRLTRDSGHADGRLVRRAALPAHHVSRAYEVSITSGARTIVDLARELPFRDAVVLADSALRRGATTREQLAEVLRDCWTWRGIRAAGRVVDFADPRAESALESLSRVGFHEKQLSPPDLQCWIAEDWQWLTRVDFLWWKQRTIAEGDGRFKYDGRVDVYAEKRLRERLEDLGFQVVPFGWRDVTEDLDGLVDRLRRAFARGEAVALAPSVRISRTSPTPWASEPNDRWLASS